MKLLSKIKGSDVDSACPSFDYMLFLDRPAVRAIVLDDEGHVALMYIKKWDYYMLPGGGIDPGEDEKEALKREVYEELGCEVEVRTPVGRIETFFDRWKQKQIDYCFIASKIADKGTTSLSAFENEEHFEKIWTPNLEQALNLITKSSPVNRDGRLVRARDMRFLEHWMKTSADSH